MRVVVVVQRADDGRLLLQFVEGVSLPPDTVLAVAMPPRGSSATVNFNLGEPYLTTGEQLPSSVTLSPLVSKHGSVG